MISNYKFGRKMYEPLNKNSLNEIYSTIKKKKNLIIFSLGFLTLTSILGDLHAKKDIASKVEKILNSPTISSKEGYKRFKELDLDYSSLFSK